MKPEDKKKLNLGVEFQHIKEVILNFIIPLVALGVTVGLVVLVIMPKFKSIPVLKEDISQKQSLDATLQTKISTLNKLVDYNEIVGTQSDLVNKVLVAEAEVPKLLDQVNQIAEESGMDVSGLGYSYGATSSEADNTTKVQFSSLSVSLSGNLSYAQLITLMKTTENAARFVKIPNLRYSTSTKDSGGATLATSLSVQSPFLLVQSTAVTDEPITLDISDQKFVDFINMLKGLKYYEFSNTTITASSTPAQ